jgi:hypothetical protein
MRRNFMHIHQVLKITPAMARRSRIDVLEISDMINMLQGLEMTEKRGHSR